MIDVDQIVAVSTLGARAKGCTCAVMVRLHVCDGDADHPEHVVQIERLHASKCRMMLREWRAWN